MGLAMIYATRERFRKPTDDEYRAVIRGLCFALHGSAVYRDDPMTRRYVDDAGKLLGQYYSVLYYENQRKKADKQGP